MAATRSSSAPADQPGGSNLGDVAGSATPREPGPDRAGGPPDKSGRVAVLLPYPLSGAFDYLAPPDLGLRPGDVVEVPLGPRRVPGVVWDTRLGNEAASSGKLKAVARRLDIPPMLPAMRRFVEWLANYTLTAPGAVLRMAISVAAALEPPRPTTAYRLISSRPAVRLTSARRRVLELLADGGVLGAAEIGRRAGVSTSVVHGLAATGQIEPLSIASSARFDLPDAGIDGPTLSSAQSAAAADLRTQVSNAAFSVTVLDGVTGSGKTEVYFEAIAATLALGRQALVMLPEIALTAQWLERFRARFGAAPAEWHSDLTPAQRRQAWRAVADGGASVVVGARSSLFLPFAALGLIVVDEEHDTAFKQEDGVTYSARDMAVVRASIEGVPVVLASATPSLESIVNVEAGRYRLLALPHRHAGARLPEINLVDLRQDAPPRGRWLSPTVEQAVTAALDAGEQALLFLNRRGYAPLTLCRACGHRLQCPNCTAWLVEHRFHRILQCHHCGFVLPPPVDCPKCGAEDSLTACGPGVERIAEEVAATFPNARHAVMASDTLTGPHAAAEFVRRVNDHEIDILIGTQIVAKGHHFPLLTMVGVVDADLGLSGGDLRAGERTYQLLAQVAGRAGRAERPGRVFLQTFDPRNPIMRALADQDRDRFLEAEKESRLRAGMPPFGRLAALIVSSPDSAAAESAARSIARIAPFDENVRVLGPAPAPLALLRGHYRFRLLLIANRQTNVQGVLRDWLADYKLDRNIRLQIDVDPYSFL